jgi:acyl-coenzyme A thioesterase PaaI-like protein
MTDKQPLHECATLGAQGFTHVIAKSPFAKQIGPFFGRVIESRPEFAIEIRPNHLNLLGSCHGGVLLALADMAMATEASWAIGGMRPCETRSMTEVEFRRPVRLGSALICATTHTRIITISRGTNIGRKIVDTSVEIHLTGPNADVVFAAKGQFVSSSSDLRGYHVLNGFSASDQFPPSTG